MNATKLLTIAVAALALTAGVAAATGTALANDHQTDAPADEAGHAQASHADDANGTDGNETADDVREMPEGDFADDDANETDENETVPVEPAQQNGVTEQSEDRQGPPADMPGPVPDHVTQIHETINDFLSGDSDGPLGHALSDLLGGQQNDERGNGPASAANDHPANGAGA